MEKLPEQIILATLEVVVVPNGEIICQGTTVGWFRDLSKYLEPKKN